jgi:hypothetical protein
MARNDEAERLDIAEEYLLTYSPSTQEFDAALEHVRWVHASKPELRFRCEDILKNVVVRRRDEAHTMAKLRAVKP